MSYISPSVTSSGLTTLAQYSAAGVNGLLEALISANFAANAVPANPTITATGGGTTGGNLPAGTVYVKVTETDGSGETTPSGEVNVAVSAGNIPQVTFAALKPGNTARNVYAGMASGAEVLYATGVTTATYNLSAAIPTNSWSQVTPPTVNSTGIVSDGNPAKMQAIRAIEKGNFRLIWDNLQAMVSDFNRGDPMSFMSATQKLRNVHMAVALFNQLLTEVGTYIDANPGTLRTTTTGIGNAKLTRSWP